MASEIQGSGGNERVLGLFMAAIGDRDLGALAEICAGDFVVELPYGDPPRRLEGFEAYRAAIEAAFEVFRFRLELVALHPGRDPDLLVAEYTSDGLAVPTGKPYRNVYIGVFRFRDGRLAFLREFFDPRIARRALEPD